MTASGWLQIVLFTAIVIALAKPLGIYLHRVFEGDRQPLPRILGPVERLMNRVSGVDPSKEQDWKLYTLSVLAFSLFGLIVTYAIQRLQASLPLNPQGFPGVEPLLAF